MARTARALIGVLLGYGVSAATGAVLIALLSTNTHDKSVEMAMTSAFVSGPIGAVIGLVIGLMWRRTAR